MFFYKAMMVISNLSPHGEIPSQCQYTSTVYDSLNLLSFSDSSIPKHASTHVLTERFNQESHTDPSTIHLFI